MKKLLTILIAVLYTIITSGFTVNVHYCMGKIAEVKLQEPKHASCNKCGRADGKSNCCKHEVKYLKMANEHQVAKTQGDMQPLFAAIALPVLEFPTIDLPVSIITNQPRANAPPGLSSQEPLYIQHNAFLI
ncbi:HYC_CC_PP family protein [Chitinophaga skermanii]|nr:hypothetical protein [Chitinophaga skermanii]